MDLQYTTKTFRVNLSTHLADHSWYEVEKNSINLKDSYIYNPPMGGEKFEFFEVEFQFSQTTQFSDTSSVDDDPTQFDHALFVFSYTQK